MKIDINCDMGEGIGNDTAIMPFISSANIACGYHAGDEETMRRTIELCLQYNVAIGAHPSFSDKKNFGRTEMHLSTSEVYELVTKQIRLFDEIVKQCGASLHHVKPHGALYNMSAKDSQLATAIALAVKNMDEKLILYGLSGSYSINEANVIGLKTAHEVFADRTYQDDGSLTPRLKAKALIEDVNTMSKQVLQMIKDKTVTSLSGKTISILADTICIHGDGKHAVEFAKTIHHVLKQNNIDIKAI